MPNCPNCGSPYEEGPDAGRYCDNCGYDLKGEPSVESARPPMPAAVSPRPSVPVMSGQVSKVVVVVLVVVMIALAGILAFVYFQSSGTISNLNSTVTSQQGALASKSNMIAALNRSIAADQAKISADLGKISSLNSTVASLRLQVNVDQARINVLTGRGSQNNATIASLNSQITTLNSEISTDQSTINGLQTTVSGLQTQVSNLETASANFANALGGALAKANVVLFDSNVQFSTPTGDYYYFPFTAGSAGEYFVVGLVTSTSSHTLVSNNSTNTSFDLGSSGVAVFFVPAGGPTQIRFYTSGYAAFTATVNIWGFY